jgi:hypothetical protein
METIPRLFLGRDPEIRKVFGPCGFPQGSCFTAAIGLQIPGAEDWVTDREASHRIVGRGIPPIAVVIVAVHVVQETPHMFAQGSVDDEERLTSASAMACRLLEHEAKRLGCASLS